MEEKMKSKIERSELDVLEEILQEVQENNEFIQKLLADGESQDQEEDTYFDCIKCGKQRKDLNSRGEWACEGCKVKDTPEEWEEEWHSTPVYNQISFIKNLLEGREDKAREEGYEKGKDYQARLDRELYGMSFEQIKSGDFNLKTKEDEK